MKLHLMCGAAGIALAAACGSVAQAPVSDTSAQASSSAGSTLPVSSVPRPEDEHASPVTPNAAALTTPAPSVAKAPTAAAGGGAQTALAARLNAMQTLQGRFQQVLRDQNGQVLQETQGQYRLKRPGYFYWQVEPPFEQIVVGTPNSLKVYDPDLEQMTLKSDNALDGTPAALLSGDAKRLFDHYSVSQRREEGQVAFTLTPRGDGDASAFASLVFYFSEVKGQSALTAMSFTDKLGQTTRIALGGATSNAALSEADFDFNPPAGTDIIVDG